MRVMTVCQVLDCLRDQLWFPKEEEANISDSSTLDVIIHIRDGKLKELLSSLRVHGASVGATDSVHATLTHD